MGDNAIPHAIRMDSRLENQDGYPWDIELASRAAGKARCMSSNELDEPVPYDVAEKQLVGWQYWDDKGCDDDRYVPIPAVRSRANGCEIPKQQVSKKILREKELGEARLKTLEGEHPVLCQVIRSIAAHMGFFPSPEKIQALADTNNEGNAELTSYQDIWQPWLDEKRPVPGRVFFHAVATADDFIYKVCPVVNHATAIRYVDFSQENYGWNTYEFYSGVLPDMGTHSAPPILTNEVTAQEQDFKLTGVQYILPMDFLQNQRGRMSYFGFTTAAHQSIRMTIEFNALLRTSRAAAKYMAENDRVAAKSIAEFCVDYEKYCDQCFPLNKMNGLLMMERDVAVQSQIRAAGSPDCILLPFGSKFLTNTTRSDTRSDPRVTERSPTYGWSMYESQKYPLSLLQNMGRQVVVDPLEVHMACGERFDTGPVARSDYDPAKYDTAYFNLQIPEHTGNWTTIDAIQPFENCCVFADVTGRPFTEEANDIFKHLVKWGMAKKSKPFRDEDWTDRDYDGISKCCTAGLLYKSTNIYEYVVSHLQNPDKYAAFSKVLADQLNSINDVQARTQQYHKTHHHRSYHSGGTHAVAGSLDWNEDDPVHGTGHSSGAGIYGAPPPSFVHDVVEEEDYKSADVMASLAAIETSSLNSNAVLLKNHLSADMPIPISVADKATPPYRVDGPNTTTYDAYVRNLKEVLNAANHENVYKALQHTRLVPQRAKLLPPGEAVRAEEAVKIDLDWLFHLSGKSSPMEWDEEGQVVSSPLSGSSSVTAWSYPSIGDVEKAGRLHTTHAAGPTDALLFLFGDEKNVPTARGGNADRMDLADKVAKQFFFRSGGSSAEERSRAKHFITNILLSPAPVFETLPRTLNTDILVKARLERELTMSTVGTGPGKVRGCKGGCEAGKCICMVSKQQAIDLLDQLRPSHTFMTTCAQQNVPFPFRCGMFRLGQWKAGSVVTLKGGVETLFTVIRKMEKMYEKMLTGYSLYAYVRAQYATLVHNPRQTYFNPYGKTNSYVCGLGKTFYTWKDSFAFRSGNKSYDKDLWAVAIPIDFEFPNCVTDCSGRFASTLVSDPIQTQGSTLYPTSTVYSRIWNWVSDPNRTYRSAGVYKNTRNVVHNFTLFGQGRQVKCTSDGRGNSTGRKVVNKATTPYGPVYDGTSLEVYKKSRDLVHGGFINQKDNELDNAIRM